MDILKCGCSYTYHEKCYNGEDDDYDGAVDCDDADCQYSDFCTEEVFEELCDNGIDDDMDGKIDCDDLKCETYFPCVEAKQGLNEEFIACSSNVTSNHGFGFLPVFIIIIVAVRMKCLR